MQRPMLGKNRGFEWSQINHRAKAEKQSRERLKDAAGLGRSQIMKGFYFLRINKQWGSTIEL